MGRFNIFYKFLGAKSINQPPPPPPQQWCLKLSGITKHYKYTIYIKHMLYFLFSLIYWKMEKN